MGRPHQPQRHAKAIRLLADLNLRCWAPPASRWMFNLNNEREETQHTECTCSSWSYYSDRQLHLRWPFVIRLRWCNVSVSRQTTLEQKSASQYDVVCLQWIIRENELMEIECWQLLCVRVTMSIWPVSIKLSEQRTWVKGYISCLVELSVHMVVIYLSIETQSPIYWFILFFFLSPQDFSAMLKYLHFPKMFWGEMEKRKYILWWVRCSVIIVIHIIMLTNLAANV